MARKRKSRRPRRKKQPNKNTMGGKKVRVKAHTRSPRGPNTGKQAVRVHGYARKRPRRGTNA